MGEKILVKYGFSLLWVSHWLLMAAPLSTSFFQLKIIFSG